MTVQVLTPEKAIFSGEATSVQLVAERGQLTILDQHANLITVVKEGPLTISTPSGKKEFSVTGGVLKCENNVVSVLCPVVMPRAA